MKVSIEEIAKIKLIQSFANIPDNLFSVLFTEEAEIIFVKLPRHLKQVESQI